MKLDQGFYCAARLLGREGWGCLALPPLPLRCKVLPFCCSAGHVNKLVPWDWPKPWLTGMWPGHGEFDPSPVTWGLFVKLTERRQGSGERLDFWPLHSGAESFFSPPKISPLTTYLFTDTRS